MSFAGTSTSRHSSPPLAPNGRMTRSSSRHKYGMRAWLALPAAILRSLVVQPYRSSRKRHLIVTLWNWTAEADGLASSHHENQHFDSGRPAAALCDRCLITTGPPAADF